MFPKFPSPTKQFKAESEFQTWFSQIVKERYGEICQHKISDQSLSLKPCDYFFFDEIGRVFFCELKCIDGYTINISKFEPQQVEFLTMLSIKSNPMVLPYAVVYSKKVHQVRYIPWHEIRDELLQNGSVQIFEKGKPSR